MLPRVVCVGGPVMDHSVAPPKDITTASVEALDVSTMRWSGAGGMPALLDPQAIHRMSLAADGSVVVCGGCNHGAADPMHHLLKTAVRWSPGGSEWASLPDLPGMCQGPGLTACVSLPDGRTMVIGVAAARHAAASVLVLAAGGSEWSAAAPMVQVRMGAAAAVLPDGKVLVAGGQLSVRHASTLKTAELYDPATNAWTALPDMAHERSFTTACVLPSGRVAVVGGYGVDGQDRKDCEAFDPVKRTWEALT